MSLQNYTANYWPGMHTTALSVHVNADFSVFIRAALV